MVDECSHIRVGHALPLGCTRAGQPAHFIVLVAATVPEGPGTRSGLQLG
jgi:hypothetical protein